MPSGLDKTLKNELCSSQGANSQAQMESDSRIDRARKSMRCSILSKEFIYHDSAHTDLKATFLRIKKEQLAQAKRDKQNHEANKITLLFGTKQIKSDE